MPPGQDPDKSVCEQCVEDLVIRRWISMSGRTGTCSYGHGDGFTVSLADLARRVDEVYIAYHRPGDWTLIGLPDELGDHDHRQEGDDPETIVEEMLLCEQELATDIVEYLAYRHWPDVADGADPMYELDWNYEFRPPSSAGHLETWNTFSRRVRFSQRFFDPTSLASLGSLLGPSKSAGVDEQLTIRPFEPGEQTPMMFRGRRVETDAELATMMTNAHRDLGPPPPVKAAAGRMNPAGISVFYGAFDEQVCVAEIRPSVGGTVVTAGFRIVRPIRLLDLTALGDFRTPGGLSMFHEDFAERYAGREFLRQFEDIVARPIQPHESEIEFVPTQMVAEYVKNVLGLDGIIYKSAQSSVAAANVVLFLPDEGGIESTLSLDNESVRAWEVTGISVTTRFRDDMSMTDLAELVQWMPQLTAEWNANQVAFVSAMANPMVFGGEFVARLVAVGTRQTQVVAAMTLRISRLDDPSVRDAATGLVENYRQRLGALKQMISAAISYKEDAFAEAERSYRNLTGREALEPVVRPLLEHPRVKALIEAVGGINVDQLINSLIGLA